MFNRGRLQPRPNQPGPCQQCLIEYQVGELKFLTGRLELVDQMYRKHKKQRRRQSSKKQLGSKYSESGILNELGRRLGRLEAGLRENSEESRRLGEAVRSISIPHSREPVSSYARQSSTPRDNRSVTMFGLNAQQMDLKSYEYNKSSRNRSRRHSRTNSESVEAERYTIEEAVQRFSGLAMQDGNRESTSELNRREELIRLAGIIRRKQRGGKSQSHTPTNEYGL